MKSIAIVLVLVAAASFSSTAVRAHHSSAMFDREKVVETKGTVRELQWSNPHIWIQVVTQENGTSREWSLEGGSPNTLSRQGWRSTTFKPGDEATFRFNPMKDGTSAGAFIGAKFADGHTIGRWD
jgi:hypothetical protein